MANNIVGQSQRVQLGEGEATRVDLSLTAMPAPIVFYTGVVVDYATKMPVADALVTLRKGSYIYRCKTAKDGVFQLFLSQFWRTAGIQIAKNGYQTRFIRRHFFGDSKETYELFCRRGAFKN